MTTTRVQATWDNAQFCDWVEQYGGEVPAAVALGVSDKTIRNWIAGRHPIPLMAELACKFLSQG